LWPSDYVLDESKKGSRGSSVGKHVSLLYKICMLMY